MSLAARPPALPDTAPGPIKARLAAWALAFGQRPPHQRVLLLAGGLTLAVTVAGAALPLSLGDAPHTTAPAQSADPLSQAANPLNRTDATPAKVDAADPPPADLLLGPDALLALVEQTLAHQPQVSLRTLRPLATVDLLGRGQPGASGGPPASHGAPHTAHVLYRHGVELVLEGPLGALMAAAQALDAPPLHRGDTQVQTPAQAPTQTPGPATAQPGAQMTLRLYSISREPSASALASHAATAAPSPAETRP